MMRMACFMRAKVQLYVETTIKKYQYYLQVRDFSEIIIPH